MDYQSTLSTAGLSEGEALIYGLLLEFGKMKAGTIIRKSALKRGNVYNILNSLVKKNLIEEFQEKGIAVYRPLHPSRLLNKVEQSISSLERSKTQLELALPDLVSMYTKSEHQPNVTHHEGEEGISLLYEDILREKKDIKLIRSPYDNDHENLASLVSRQIKKQVQAGIHTKAITPLMEDTPRTVFENDKDRLVTRRIVSKDKFMIPAQLIIYGSKVGITSYKNKLVTTIIDNVDIKELFDCLFEYVWENSENEHTKIISSLQ